MTRSHAVAWLAFAGLIFACSSSSTDGAHGPGAPGDPDGSVSADGAPSGGGDGGLGSDGSSPDGTQPGAGRDWTRFPAIVEQASFTTLYALSDVHGGYDRLTALLTKWSLISGAPATPAAAAWTAGDATLVVTGDMIDKGPSSPDVINFLRALEASAAAAGGHVIVALGNHEAEFLVNPLNSKASGPDGIDPQLMTLGITPAAYSSNMDPHGQWLRQRPFGARVEKWFFSHAGDTGGRTVVQLEAALRPAVDLRAYNDPEVIGTSSLLESRDWYLADTALAGRNAAALGAVHIVFGHSPAALGARGTMGMDAQKTLFRIDCGMSPVVNDSSGAIFRVTHAAGNEVAEELRADGSVRTPALYTGP